MHPLNKHNVKSWKRNGRRHEKECPHLETELLSLNLCWHQALDTVSSITICWDKWMKEEKIRSSQYPGGAFSCLTQRSLHWLSCRSREQVPLGRLSLLTKLLRQTFFAEMHMDLRVPYTECWGQRVNGHKGPFQSERFRHRGNWDSLIM